MAETFPGYETALTKLVREHPAVAEALVVEGAESEGPTVWIVPDERAAPMLHRSVVIEDAGRLGALAWHEPADALRVAGLNRGETDFLYREIFTDGAYLRKDIDLPPNAVVVDVGANIGMFALRAGRRSRGARIIAVEPVAELAEAVRVNAELHGIDVTVLCTALGDADAETDFTFYPHNSVMSGLFADVAEDEAVLKGYLLTGDDPADTAQLDRMVTSRMRAQRRRVPVTTLASVAAAYAPDRIDLLKVDVEKAEMQVLGGVGDDLWPRIDRVVMEVHDVDGRLAAAIALLEGKGFAVDVDQDPRLVLTPCFSVYAHRGGLPVAFPPQAPPGNGPTLRELTRDLRRMIAERRPETRAPGRVDVVAKLPAAEVAQAEPPASARPDATRRTQVLAEAWTMLFGADAVHPDADYFELGGTSLLALRLLDYVEQALGDDVLTAEMIYAAGTFGALAAALDTTETDSRRGPADV